MSRSSLLKVFSYESWFDCALAYSTSSIEVASKLAKYLVFTDLPV